MAITVDVALESAIENVGGMGTFQILLITIVTGSKFAIACGMLLMSYGGKIPDWWCVDGDFLTSLGIDGNGNGTHTNETYQVCYPNNGTECSNIEYTDELNTVVTLYSLVCSRKSLATTITSIQLAGVLIGCLATGQIADIIGRKKTFFTLIILHAVFCALSIFEVNWMYFAAIRFLIGTTAGGVLSVDFSIPVEFTGQRWRSAMAMIPSWGVGSLFFALMAYLVHDWLYLTIITVAVTLPFLLGWFVVPESMRWLITKKRYEEARQSLEMIARINRKGEVDLSMIDELQKNPTRTEKTEKVYSFIDLIRTREMAKKTLPSVFVWASMGLGYYGIAFGVVALSGDIYMNLALSAAVDIPQNFLVAYMCHRIGRRKTNLICFSFGAISALGVVPASYIFQGDTRGEVVNVLAMLCKFGVGSGWVAYKLHTAELFPTVVRTLSSGVCNAASRIGGIIAPQLIYLTQLNGSLMYLVIGILSALSALVSQMVEETKGVVLPDVIVSPDDKLTQYAPEPKGETNAAFVYSVPDVTQMTKL